MSGIVGIYYLDGRPVERSKIQGMLNTISHRGPDGSEIWMDGPAALGCQLLRVTPESAKETQPFVHHSETVVVFDGRLDNREELLPQLKTSIEVSAESPDPAFVLAAYDVFGDSFTEHLVGDFALGLLDPNHHKLLLARDVIGVRPLYYYSTPKQFLFASEVKGLLAHPQVSTRPNDNYLAEFLFNGLSGEDGDASTFFSGVSTLPPGFMVIVTPEGLLKWQYRDFDPTRSIRFKSSEEYVEGFRHHFEQAVRRRLRSMYPVAVSVSGGLDSSSIFCLAETIRKKSPEAYPEIIGLSYILNEGTPQDERSFLSDIERDYSLSINRFPAGPQGIVDGNEEEVWYTEAPLLNSVRNFTEPLFKNVQRSGARLLLSGDMGDQMLFDQAYLLDLFSRLEWRKVWRHLRQFGKWNLDVNPKSFRRLFFRNLFKSNVSQRIFPYLRGIKRKLVKNHLRFEGYEQNFRKLARQRTSNKMSSPESRPATAHSKSLQRKIKSRYNIFLREWINKVASVYGVEFAFPFLDQDLVSYLLATPGEVQMWEGVPKGILRKAMHGVLPTRILERRWKGDGTDLLNDRVARDFPKMLQYFQSDGMAAGFGYVDEKILSSQLIRLGNKIQRPDCLASWALCDLLGLELWLRAFFGETVAEKGVSAA